MTAPDEVDLSLNRPSAGCVERWVRWVIGSACVITVVVAGVGAREILFYAPCVLAESHFWFNNGLAIALALWLVINAAPQFRLSRFVHLALVLPVTHAATMIAVWAWWTSLNVDRPWFEPGPIGQLLPMSWVVGALTAICCIAGALLCRRRGEWIHAATVIALSFLLLLGLWLPIASALWCAPSGLIEWTNVGLQLRSPPALIATVIAPPLGLALGFTARSLRARGRGARPSTRLKSSLGVLALVAVMLRIFPSSLATVVYGFFVHVLFGASIVAVLALVGLGVASWKRRWPGDALDGIIADDGGGPVAAFEISSWLRGPRPVLRGFSVLTKRGEIPISCAARVDCSLPEGTTVLRRGESHPVLGPGDSVWLGGLVAMDVNQPFRDSDALIAGSDGISIIVPELVSNSFTNVTLAIWRPCVAYLLITLAIAVPALVTLVDH